MRSDDQVHQHKRHMWLSPVANKLYASDFHTSTMTVMTQAAQHARQTTRHRVTANLVWLHQRLN